MLQGIVNPLYSDDVIHIKFVYTHTHSLAEQEYMEEMLPFTEEDLSILYPNPQLDSQSVFVDTFIRVRDMQSITLCH